MVEPVSPLEPLWTPGRHGNPAADAGVTLSETRPGSIVQATAFPGEEKALRTAISGTLGLTVPDAPGAGAIKETVSAFGTGPGRYLIIDQVEGLAERLTQAIDSEIGTVIDLSHGRTAIRIAGPKAEWVLSKLFAIDFAVGTFPEEAGCSTAHHDIFTTIQRTGAEQFDLYVFRSYARSFWRTLCHASEDVGYQVK